MWIIIYLFIVCKSEKYIIILRCVRNVHMLARDVLTLLRDVAKRKFQNMQNIHLDEKCISEANS